LPAAISERGGTQQQQFEEAKKIEMPAKRLGKQEAQEAGEEDIALVKPQDREELNS
jgi:hypothetical protein